MKNRLTLPSLVRSAPTRVLRARILVVGEGTTEPLYFQGLSRLDEVRVAYVIRTECGVGVNPEVIVKHAIKCRRRKQEEFDETWCVLDVEEPSKAQSLERAKALASNAGIRLFLSNPCFEVWLLSHLTKTHRAFSDASAVARFFEPLWRSRFGVEYSKTDASSFAKIGGEVRSAIANAKWVLEEGHQPPSRGDVCKCNSSTEVFRAVEMLLPAVSSGTRARRR